MKVVKIVFFLLLSMCVAKAQNVGIGTISPLAKLDIKGISASETNHTLLIRNSNSDSLFRISDTGVATLGSARADFGQLAIINNGKFQPHLTLAATNIFGNTGVYISSMHFSGVDNTDRYWRMAASVYGPDNESFNNTKSSIFSISNDSIPFILALRGDGRVGVGQAFGDDRSKFYVGGSVGAVSAMFLDNATKNGLAIENSYPGIGLNTYYNGGRKMIGPGFGGLIGVNPTNGDLYFYNNAASVANSDGLANLNLRMVIDKNGRVGIGVAAPAQALDVTGFIHSSGLNGGVTSLSVDASGNIIRTPSDARLKCEITPIENALSKLRLLQGVTYDFKDKKRFGEERQMGFLAQNVETIAPEAVSNGGEYKSVNYPVLVALLTEALKEVDKKNMELQRRVAKLEKKVYRKK